VTLALRGHLWYTSIMNSPGRASEKEKSSASADGNNASTDESTYLIGG